MKKKTSFRVLLTFSILFMALVPTILLSVYYYVSSKAILINTRQESLSSSISVASTLFDMSCGRYMNGSYLNTMVEDTTNSIPYESIDSVFSADQQNRKAELFRIWKRSIIQQLNQFKIRTSLLEGDYSVYLYFPKEHVLFDSSSTFYEHVSGTAFQRLYPAADISENGRWCSLNKLSYYKEKTDTLITLSDKYLSFVSLVPDNGSHQTKAIAIVNFDPDIFNNISYKHNYNSDGALLIFRQDGNYLLGDDNFSPQIIEEVQTMLLGNHIVGNREIVLDGKSYVFAYENIGEEFILVELSPTDLVTQELNDRASRIIIVAALIVAGFVFISFQLAKFFYNPLNRLYQHINYVKGGDLTKRIVHDRSDEYGQVFDCYNEMLDQINDLIENNTNEKLLRAEAELFLLQERINPHFIYNSLEIIYSLAKLNRTEEIPRITKALSDFFRMCLSDGSADVPLTTALDICEKYLIIQNTRFYDKINYSVSVEDGLESCIVPKYAIQILVENAVVHGIEPLLRPGNIQTTVIKENNMVIISVIDDGIGISLGKIEELNHQINSPKSTGNYALKNLNRQIIVRYGDQYGVKLLQPENGGTCAQITLPYSEGE